MAKPSEVFLHYNYGAAAVKWWGHHTETLRSQPPQPPPPLPHQRRGRRPRPAPAPAPAPGPSTGLRYRGTPVVNWRATIPMTTSHSPTSTHDWRIGIQKRQQHSTDEPVNESKVWES
ncbi:hypothetical protein F5888DRAFT_1809327 [Russula emetica]|nr:hypothetical protein F5888DRAFT_1809327 [Russula emetica]